MDKELTIRKLHKELLDSLRQPLYVDLRQPLYVDYKETDKFVLRRLISIRNSDVNRNDINLKTNFDSVIRFFLDEEEFKKYVLDKEELK